MLLLLILLSALVLCTFLPSAPLYHQSEYHHENSNFILVMQDPATLGLSLMNYFSSSICPHKYAEAQKTEQQHTKMISSSLAPPCGKRCNVAVWFVLCCSASGWQQRVAGDTCVT